MLEHPERRQSFAVVVAAAVSWSLRDLSLVELSKAATSLGLSTSMLIALAVLCVGGLVSLLFFYVFSAAATAAGKYMLGGTGEFKDVRTAIAWGLAPQVWAILFRVPAVIFWPEAVAGIRGSKRRVDLTPGEPSIALSLIDAPTYQLVILISLEVGILAWYLTTGSRTLAEAQGFSSARGLANLLIAVVLPFAVIAVLAIAAFLAVATT